MSQSSDPAPRRRAQGAFRERWRRLGSDLVRAARRIPTPASVFALVAFAFLAGVHAGTLSRTMDGEARALESELAGTRAEMERLEDRLAAVRMDRDRLRAIHRFSASYGISTDLAERIRGIALEEGVDPELAFRLVAVESSFRSTAVSAKGAVGYTQIKPSTARWLDPTISQDQLFEPETNLRLGFRYLRQLLDRYDGDRRLALLAYNQGPGRVGAKLSLGRDPGNGYARTVLRAGQ